MAKPNEAKPWGTRGACVPNEKRVATVTLHMMLFQLSASSRVSKQWEDQSRRVLKKGGRTPRRGTHMRGGGEACIHVERLSAARIRSALRIPSWPRAAKMVGVVEGTRSEPPQAGVQRVFEAWLSTKIFARPHRVIDPAGSHLLTDECHNAAPRLASRLINAVQIITAWSPGDKSVKKPGWLTKSPKNRDSSRVYRPSSLGRTGMGR
ncbi:hypothetical protein C8R44DRAFT_848050 [Mycena epipterygia]|nr:hypothetical protein C8R44DRAFT_848050 [Mycena epipterygia]